MVSGLRPARLGRRLVAGAIDLMPWVGLSLAVFRPPAELYDPNLSLPDLWKGWTAWAGSSAAAWGLILNRLLYLAYCTFTEARYGLTLGKRLLGLHVIDDSANRPDLRKAGIRNLLKILELALPLLLLLPLLNSGRQRLGDILAHTVVVEPADGVRAYPPGPTEQGPGPPEPPSQPPSPQGPTDEPPSLPPPS